MARYRIGNDMTILWSITNKDGSPFPLAGKEVHLYYTCERGRYEAAIEIQNNVVSWEFLASRQKALGGYTLTLEVLQSDGKRALKRDLCDAFVLVGKNCEEKFDHDGAHIEEGGIVNLVTSLEVYRVSPIIPYVVKDENGIGYWYVDGVNTGDRSTGESAYEYAVSKGYQGTEEEFASILALVPTDHDSIVKIENTLPNKADKIGRYPEMSVGFADDLVGRGESVPAEFSFRASGGKSIKDGTARIKAIKGNSVVWNNMVDTRGYDAGFLIREGIKIQQGHKYLLQRSASNASMYFIPIVDGSESYDMVLRDGEHAKIFISQYTDTTDARVFAEGYCGACVITDLTQMFQAGNEPTTIEEYEARKPIVADEYAYNEGQVIHCNTESIKSIGDNALNVDRSLVFDFDGSYENHDFINTEDAFVGISADGYVNQDSIDYAIKIEGGFRLHTNSGGYGIGLFVKALPNEEYSVSYASDKGRIAFGFYDKDKNFISYEMWGNRFTTPSNCEYIMLCLRDNEVVDTDISFTDIMLTLVHSGWPLDTDAGYRSYWEDKLPLPIIRKYFPQGMKSSGSEHDEIRFNKASGKWEYSKGKIKSVDLGDLTWETPWYNDNGGWRIFAQLQGKSFGLSNILNKRYANAGVADGAMSDKSITGNDNLDYIYIRDSSFSAEGANALIASLQGVMLYYESKDWEWVELDAEDQNFRDHYKVADFGTEQAISSVASAPFSADIIYQFNAVDMIRELWLKVQELESRLNNGGL